MSTIQSDHVTCSSCRARHGQALPAGVYNRGRDDMGHAMYNTSTGETAVCILRAATGDQHADDMRAVDDGLAYDAPGTDWDQQRIAWEAANQAGRV